VSPEQTSLAFRENTVRALEDSVLRAAMKQATDTFGTKRADAFAPVADLEVLDDLFAAVSGAPPTNMTLVTGPSRTADIELILAIGVHEKLDVIVV
jgi:L-lactate utilization protein LutB